MLKELIVAGFGYQENDYPHSLNCAEKIINGANIVYNLKMDDATLHMASGFAAGAFMGGTCGALCAAIMVIGRLETGFSQHQTPSLRHKLEKMLGDYQADTDS